VSTSSTFAIELPLGLLQGVRSGDASAFERLYRLFEVPVYSLAMRLLGDADEAMDVMHDTFMKVARSLADYRGDAPFWGWLRRIAVNEALMRLRRRNSQPGLDPLPEDELRQGDERGPLQLAEAAGLERAMAKLPDITRCVLWLYHAEGYTHEEVAHLMGRTASFSKSQLARGTQRLRLALAAPAAASPSLVSEIVHVK